MAETAVITGAAGGIGEHTARRLAADGVRCVLVDRDPLVRHIATNLGGEAIIGDLTDPATSRTAVAAAGERVDLLVLNAGTNSADKDPADLDLDRYHAVVGVNQHAVVWGLRAPPPGVGPAGRRFHRRHRLVCGNQGRPAGPDLHHDQTCGHRFGSCPARFPGTRGDSAERGMPRTGGHSADRRRAGALPRGRDPDAGRGRGGRCRRAVAPRRGTGHRTGRQPR